MNRSSMGKLVGSIALMAFLSMAGCSGGQSGSSKQGAGQNQQAAGQAQAGQEAPKAAIKKVDIATIIDHPALNQVRDGVKEKLLSLGYKEGETIAFKMNSAQGNTSIAGQIAKQYVSESPDVIVAVATPVAQAMVSATSEIPVVYAAVTDPVEAKLIKDWNNSGNNVTGVSDMLPLDQQIDLMKELVPNLKKVGYVYSPGEVNSTVVLKELEEKLKAQGITLVSVAAPRTTDIPSAALSLAGKVDLIYSSLDNNVTSAYESLFQAGKQMKVPLISADTGNVPRGAVAALGVNYKEIGMETGEIVDQILKGAKPADIPSRTMKKLDLYVSTENAKALGIEIPASLIEKADFVDGKPKGGEASNEGQEAGSEAGGETEGEAK